MEKIYDSSLMEEYEYSMQTQGYFAIENYLDPKSVGQLNVSLMEAVETYDYNKYENERAFLDRFNLHALMCQHVSFVKLLEDVRLQQLLEPILGEYWIMYAFTSSSAPPKSTNYGGRVHVDSPRHIPGYPTNAGILWALDDFTIENGATQCLPGSHHSGTVPSDDYFKANAVNLECPAGTILIFNARLVHSTGFNNTDQWRHALTLNACRSYMKQRVNWVNIIPKEFFGQVNQQARRIIGYDTRVPSSWDELFLPEDQRLYKPGQG
jgi:ectoine hydroxylase-related dioxygenase (phytanoyl-CoA dioxygenase family)